MRSSTEKLLHTGIAAGGNLFGLTISAAFAVVLNVAEKITCLKTLAASLMKSLTYSRS